MQFYYLRNNQLCIVINNYIISHGQLFFFAKLAVVAAFYFVGSYAIALGNTLYAEYLKAR
jgi:hypothetical protein